MEMWSVNTGPEAEAHEEHWPTAITVQIKHTSVSSDNNGAMGGYVDLAFINVCMFVKNVTMICLIPF